jgi:uncharacterized protein (TIGR04255 family)
VLETLESPPLVEAVCEFRLSPKSEWDWTTPGRLYDLLVDEFPKKQQVSLPGFAVELGSSVQAMGFTHQSLERVQMIRDDGSAMLQVGPRLLSVHHMLPYPGWPEYSLLIERVLNLYKKITTKISFQRVGLRYINQISTPSGNLVDIASLITLEPPIPSEIAKPLSNFYQRYELLHEAPVGLLVHQTGYLRTPNGNNVVLDLDFGSMELSAPQESDVVDWLTAAHERIEEAFIASVGPSLLESMKSEGKID